MMFTGMQAERREMMLSGYQNGLHKGGGGSTDTGAKEATALQKEMWQTTMQNLAPFTPLAQQYVSQLQGLSTLQGQGQALNQYYNSDQYKQLADQARYQSLGAAEATGGLGSTATSNQLASIAPTLGQNWLAGQMNNYQNLANIGLGALQGQTNAGQSYANNAGQIAQQQAALSSANGNQPSKVGGFLAGAGAGAAAGSVAGPWGAAIGGAIGGISSLF
jgi:hypothetical protein